MTRDDVIKIMSVLRGAYPQFYRDISKQEAMDIINLWSDMFAYDDPELVAAAVKSLIATDDKGFPPHIGAVKAKVRQITQPSGMTPQEAWNLVAKAIRNSAYESREEYGKLPKEIQRLVGSPNQLRDWATMDSETVHSVVASNFQRSFVARQKADNDFKALPRDVQAMIGTVAERMALHD